jgi:hypothetical protein
VTSATALLRARFATAVLPGTTQDTPTRGIAYVNHDRRHIRRVRTGSSTAHVVRPASASERTRITARSDDDSSRWTIHGAATISGQCQR